MQGVEKMAQKHRSLRKSGVLNKKREKRLRKMQRRGILPEKISSREMAVAFQRYGNATYIPFSRIGVGWFPTIRPKQFEKLRRGVGAQAGKYYYEPDNKLSVPGKLIAFSVIGFPEDPAKKFHGGRFKIDLEKNTIERIP